MRSHSIDYVINCVGLIRQKITASDFSSVDAAVTANIGIPLKLVRLSEKYNFKILQIGTDCVFSGTRGKYSEQDSHDALDLYGKTKSIGEIPHQNVALIRSSIVGLEANSSLSLMSWLLSQTENAIVDGYNDQFWNGITVLHFAKLVMGIVSSNNFDIFSGVHHFIPSDFASKGEMLELFAESFNRKDIRISHVPSGNRLDMRLGTSNTEFNKILWKTAGYEAPKSIEEMVVEYSLASKRWGVGAK